jgi:hypothetical protein
MLLFPPIKNEHVKVASTQETASCIFQFAKPSSDPSVHWEFSKHCWKDSPQWESIYLWCKQFETKEYICKGKMKLCSMWEKPFSTACGSPVTSAATSWICLKTAVWHVLMKADRLQWTQALKPNDRRKLHDFLCKVQWSLKRMTWQCDLFSMRKPISF